MRLCRSALFAALAAFGPGLAPIAVAQDLDAFDRGETVHLGDVDIRLGKEDSRWVRQRQGNIDLDKNTYLFGREDTYESMLSRKGIADPAVGATVGLGMTFKFDYGK